MRWMMSSVGASNGTTITTLPSIRDLRPATLVTMFKASIRVM